MKTMSERNYGHPGNDEAVNGSALSDLHGKVRHEALRYWKRAHRSRVFWIGLFLMLPAALIYALSDDLALLPGGRRGTSLQTRSKDSPDR